MNKFKFLLVFIGLLSITSLGSLQSQELKRVDKFFKTEYYKGDNLISKKDVAINLQNNEEAYKHWKKSITFNTIAWSSIGVEYGFLFWAIFDGKKENNIAKTGVYSFGAIALIAILISQKQSDKAIEKYNNGIKEEKKVTFKPSKKGFGIVMQF